MSKLRVGIVGCGTIFHHHYAFIQSYGKATLCAVADKDEKALEKVRSLYGIEHCYTDLEEMIRKEGTHVIHITTPPQTHALLAKTAFNLRNHVLIEKPMTLDYQSALKLYDLAQENGVKLCVDHNHLFDPWMLKAKEVLDKMRYEDVVYVESYYGINVQIPEIINYPAPNEISWIFSLPGGLFHDFIAHPLYLMLEYTGRPVRIETIGRCNGALFQDLTDELHVMIAGENAVGKLTISFNAKPFQHFLRIYHKKMLVNVDFNYMTMIVNPMRKMPGAVTKIVNNLNTATGLTGQTFSNVFKFVTGKLKPYSGMQNLIHGFYNSINNSGKVPVSRENVLDVMSTIDEVWKGVGKVHPTFENIPGKAFQRVSSKGKVLITGAGGFLGRRLTEILVKRGYTVRVLLRKLSRIDYFKELGAEVHYGDVRDHQTLKKAMSGMDYTVHAAAAQEGDWEVFEQTTMRGTEAVFEFAREFNMKRLVYISSMSVYQISGLKSGSFITEDAQFEKNPQARGFYTWSKLEAEKIAQQRIESEDGVPTVILRPATIYGPGGPIFTPLIGISAFDRVFVTLGKSSMRLPMVYIDNLIDAILLSLENENAVGETFNIIDDDGITKRNYIVRYIKKAFPRSWSVFLPYWFVYLSVFAQEMLFKVVGQSPILTRYRLASSSNNVLYDNSKAKSKLGWTPTISLQEGLKETFSWFKEHL